MNVVYLLLFVDLVICAAVFFFNYCFRFTYDRHSKRIKSIFPEVDHLTDKEIYHLLLKYAKRNSLEKAYILSKLKDFDISLENFGVMLEYYNDDNFYCQKNLITICCQEPSRLIAYFGKNYHKQLINNRLFLEEIDFSNFNADDLYEYYPTADVYQCLILDILNNIPKTYPLYTMWDTVDSKDEKCSMLNYFNRHYCDEELPYIMQALDDDDWEIKFLALRCLGNSPDNLHLIISYIDDSNWYLRKCAAESILKIAPDFDITQITDKYGREMLEYEREAK